MVSEQPAADALGISGLDPTMPAAYAPDPPFPEPSPDSDLGSCGANPRASRRQGQRPGSGPALRPPAFSPVTTFAWLATLTSALLRPVAAAAVSFDNCLSKTYINNVPTPLQWVPLWVDAAFDTVDPKHTLRVTMWGNVTGSFTDVALPPPGSPDWANPNKTDGKVLDEPQPNAPDPKLTTLHSKIDVLTYEPWSQNTNFCNTSLTNGSCPLAPVFVPPNSR